MANAKVLGLKQLLQKKFNYLEGLSDEMKASFGNMVDAFVMLIFGDSGNGKSNFIMQILKSFMPHGKVLYISLEEGTEASIVANVLRHLNELEHTGKIEFADHTMTYEQLMIRLKKKKQAKFIIIDSIQYWDITYDQYKTLKESFPKKAFIIISHIKGKKPDGVVANKIRYDAPIKVYIEKYIAFPVSRYGGNKPFVIWEEQAKVFWGDNYKNVVAGLPISKKTKRAPTKKSKTKKSTDLLTQ